MSEDLRSASQRYTVDIRATNRALMEKALHMRCLAYLAKAKAGLLNQTIAEVNRTKQTLRQSFDHLSEEQRLILRQKAELEAANEALRSFSYAVSHDLRAPLRGLQGLAETLSRDYASRLDERGRDYLQRLQSTAHRMSDLIEGMLLLTQIARAELRRRPVDLSAMAAHVLRELREAAPERQVQVHVQPGLVVEADPQMMHSLVQNLLGNAWKYTGRTADARIDVAAAERDGRRGFAFTDNGIGFDRARATRLFTPFGRMHADSDFPGLGVGLATVKRIVERHGGHIEADSAPGRGTCIFVSLG
ncbi:MAG: ATP-binding protein [Aquabacterium sp.]|nr:ATP-binding protein [Aquabacterium sp.]